MNKPNLPALKQFFSHLSVKWGSLTILTLTTALVYNQFFLAKAYVELDLEVVYDQRKKVEDVVIK